MKEKQRIERTYDWWNRHRKPVRGVQFIWDGSSQVRVWNFSWRTLITAVFAMIIICVMLSFVAMYPKLEWMREFWPQTRVAPVLTSAEDANSGRVIMAPKNLDAEAPIVMSTSLVHGKWPGQYMAYFDIPETTVTTLRSQKTNAEYWLLDDKRTETVITLDRNTLLNTEFQSGLRVWAQIADGSSPNLAWRLGYLITAEAYWGHDVLYGAAVALGACGMVLWSLLVLIFAVNVISLLYNLTTWIKCTYTERALQH